MKFLVKTAISLSMVLMATSSSHAEDAAAELCKTQMFAFGGVGIAAVITPGEKHFKAVLRERDSLEQFRKVLAKGTAPAQLYALCGIRELDPGSFEQASAALQK